MKIQKGVFVDELDSFLLKEIYESFKRDDSVNTWSLAKLFVANKMCKEDVEEVYRKNKIEVDYIYRRISFKIRQYINKGVINVYKNGDNKEVLKFNLDNFAFAKHKFGGTYKNCLLISIN